jgi:hypothetical protein
MVNEGKAMRRYCDGAVRRCWSENVGCGYEERVERRKGRRKPCVRVPVQCALNASDYNNASCRHYNNAREL